MHSAAKISPLIRHCASRWSDVTTNDGPGISFDIFFPSENVSKWTFRVAEKIQQDSTDLVRIFFFFFAGRCVADLFKFLTDAAISFFIYSHTKYPTLASFQTAAAADATIYDDQGRVSQSLLVGGLVNNHREPCHEERSTSRADDDDIVFG